MVLVSRVVLAGAACAAVALTGCSVSVDSQEATISRENLEKGIADALEKEVGQRPDSVECPGSVKVEKGESIRCALTAGSDRLGLTATVESYDVDKGTAQYDVKVDDTMVGN